MTPTRPCPASLPWQQLCPHLSQLPFAAKASNLRQAGLSGTLGSRTKPIIIDKSNLRYAFEGENDLKQKAEGSLRRVGEAEVVVMKGEYSYIGLDGNEWKVHSFHIPRPSFLQNAHQLSFLPNVSFLCLIIIPMARLNGMLTRLVSTRAPLSFQSLLSQTILRLQRR